MSSRHQASTLFGIVLVGMVILSLLYLSQSNDGGPLQQQQQYHGGSSSSSTDESSETISIPVNQYRQLQAKLGAVNKQYESLYEYKQRLEKAYLSMKTEKTSLEELERREKIEFNELKELYTKQVQTLQDDLKSCRDQLQSLVLSSSRNVISAGAASAGSAGPSAISGNNELPVVLDPYVISGPNNNKDPSMLDSSVSASLSASATNNNNQPQSVLSSIISNTNANSNNHGANNAAAASNKLSNIVHDKSSFSVSTGVDHASVGTGNNVIRSSMVSNVLKEAIQSPIAQVPMEPAQPSSDPNQDLVGNVLI